MGKNKQNVTNLGPVRNSQEGVTPQNLSTEILKGIGVPRSRDIGGHLLGHQESVDVDPCARSLGTTPTLFLPDCATGGNRTLGLHLRTLESVVV